MAALYPSGHVSLPMMIRSSNVKIKGTVKIFYLVSLPFLIDEIFISLPFVHELALLLDFNIKYVI
jgi:hypothetical protein